MEGSSSPTGRAVGGAHGRTEPVTFSEGLAKTQLPLRCSSGSVHFGIASSCLGSPLGEVLFIATWKSQRGRTDLVSEHICSPQSI